MFVQEVLECDYRLNNPTQYCKQEVTNWDGWYGQDCYNSLTGNPDIDCEGCYSSFCSEALNCVNGAPKKYPVEVAVEKTKEFFTNEEYAQQVIDTIHALAHQLYNKVDEKKEVIQAKVGAAQEKVQERKQLVDNEVTEHIRETYPNYDPQTYVTYTDYYGNGYNKYGELIVPAPEPMPFNVTETYLNL